MNQTELDVLLNRHALTWIEPTDPDMKPDGERLQIDNQDLSGLDFSNRDLRSCRLVKCNLSDTNFEGSNISHAEFMESDLSGANMNVLADEGTDYFGCIR